VSGHNSVTWGPTARKEQPHQFQPGTEGNPRWCSECGWAEDAYVHAPEEDRRAFDEALDTARAYLGGSGD
jgi:hypothetical protein